MRIEMIPSQIRKIDNISVGNGSVVCSQRHARLDIFPMVLERMLRNFFVFGIGLIDPSDFC